MNFKLNIFARPLSKGGGVCFGKDGKVDGDAQELYGHVKPGNARAGAGAALFAFGAVMFRAGRETAQNAQIKREQKDNEQVDKVIRAHSGLSRAELLARLHDDKNK